ncbi:MAG TPA: SGNH/GDSL hydrolase family protein [Acidobacteriaceae bacterium]|nr:SGNH/GDSL hydrolase family protein [Acidobacteriaceae bacterium]
MSRFAKFVCASVMMFVAAIPAASFAATPDHWVGTWATSPMGASNEKGVVGTTDATLREIVHVSLGGSTVRVVFTNEFGTDPLTIGAASIALAPKGSDVQSTTALAFHGAASVTIPPGALVLSDPIALNLPALSDLAISLFLPAQAITSITQHGAAYQTNWMVEGNHVADKSLDGASKFGSWRFVKGVEVLASANGGAIVAFGDSITDGAHSTLDTNSRWPDVLAARLHADKKTAGLAVLNEGIGGNRLLHDIAGPSALARFDRDVLGQSGVRYLIVLEGINDIGRTAQPLRPGDPVTTPQILMALQQIIDRAHAHGIKVYGATLTPYHSAKYASADGETMRAAENSFIRSGKFDGVIDFDKATQDPANPLEFLPADDSGDHLHPNDAGYKVMGDSIDLKLFEK